MFLETDSKRPCPSPDSLYPHLESIQETQIEALEDPLANLIQKVVIMGEHPTVSWKMKAFRAVWIAVAFPFSLASSLAPTIASKPGKTPLNTISAGFNVLDWTIISERGHMLVCYKETEVSSEEEKELLLPPLSTTAKVSYTALAVFFGIGSRLAGAGASYVIIGNLPIAIVTLIGEAGYQIASLRYGLEAAHISIAERFAKKMRLQSKLEQRRTQLLNIIENARFQGRHMNKSTRRLTFPALYQKSSCDSKMQQVCQLFQQCANLHPFVKKKGLCETIGKPLRTITVLGACISSPFMITQNIVLVHKLLQDFIGDEADSEALLWFLGALSQVSFFYYAFLIPYDAMSVLWDWVMGWLYRGEEPSLAEEYHPYITGVFRVLSTIAAAWIYEGIMGIVSASVSSEIALYVGLANIFGLFLLLLQSFHKDIDEVIETLTPNEELKENKDFLRRIERFKHIIKHAKEKPLKRMLKKIKQEFPDIWETILSFTDAQEETFLTIPDIESGYDSTMIVPRSFSSSDSFSTSDTV